MRTYGVYALRLLQDRLLKKHYWPVWECLPTWCGWWKNCHCRKMFSECCGCQCNNLVHWSHTDLFLCDLYVQKSMTKKKTERKKEKSWKSIFIKGFDVHFDLTQETFFLISRERGIENVSYLIKKQTNKQKQKQRSQIITIILCMLQNQEYRKTSHLVYFIFFQPFTNGSR